MTAIFNTLWEIIKEEWKAYLISNHYIRENGRLAKQPLNLNPKKEKRTKPIIDERTLRANTVLAGKPAIAKRNEDGAQIDIEVINYDKPTGKTNGIDLQLTAIEIEKLKNFRVGKKQKLTPQKLENGLLVKAKLIEYPTFSNAKIARLPDVNISETIIRYCRKALEDARVETNR